MWLLCIAIYYSCDSNRLGFIPGSYRYNYFEPEAWGKSAESRYFLEHNLRVPRWWICTDSSSEEDERVSQGFRGSIDSRVTIDSWQNQRYKPLQGGWCRPFDNVGRALLQ